MKRPRSLALAFAALSLSFAFSAVAQTPDEIDRARTQFREGLALSAAQDWSGALAKFKAVAQVKMTPQVAFNIAECEEHLGRLVSALGNYRLAASEAEAAKAKDVAAQVGPRMEALEERIPKLVVERGEGAESAVIELDGVELGAGQIGSEIPVDPGAHVLVGKINGQEATRENITIAERESKTVPLVIDLELLRPKQPDKPIVEGPKADDKKAEPSDPTMAYVITGAGGVSLAAGVVFMILRSGTISDLDGVCTDGHCPKSAQSTADSGKLYTGLAEVTIPLGVAGVAVGVYMLLNQGPGDEAPVAVEASPTARFQGVKMVATSPGADLAGASLVGSF